MSAKSINSLMAYLRNKHNIDINGSDQKRKLRNMGYYHGFKGYRFINKPINRISYNDFSQLQAIYSFDMKLKTLFYPKIMFIETALKNYVLEEILKESKSESFNKIYAELLIDYKNYVTGNVKYKEAMKKRLNLRNSIFKTLTRDYSNNKMLVQHFFHKDMNLPIWAIFEIISLGEFGNFVSCLHIKLRKKISVSLNLNQGCDNNGKLTQTIIYTIKDLRNSIAHNDVIFDTRFRNMAVGKSLISCLVYDTNVTNIDFKCIVDYVVLIVYIMKNLKVTKTEIKKFILEFETICENLRKEIPVPIYNKIIYTNAKNKLNSLKKFIK